MDGTPVSQHSWLPQSESKASNGARRGRQKSVDGIGARGQVPGARKCVRTKTPTALCGTAFFALSTVPDSRERLRRIINLHAQFTRPAPKRVRRSERYLRVAVRFVSSSSAAACVNKYGFKYTDRDVHYGRNHHVLHPSYPLDMVRGQCRKRRERHTRSDAFHDRDLLDDQHLVHRTPG